MSGPAPRTAPAREQGPSIVCIEAGGAAVAARPFRVGDRHFVTIAVKAEIDLASGIPMIVPATMTPEDRPSADGATLDDASDLAIYLGRGELLFFGKVHGRGDDPTGCLRVVSGNGANERVVLEKRVRATGPRPIPADFRSSHGHERDPFNPIGRPDAPLRHETAPTFPAALGPVPSAWPARRSLLRPEDFAGLAESIPHVAAGFNFNWFHAAPTDQRAAGWFDGAETIILEGLSPWPRIDLRLPRLRAEAARLRPVAGGHAQPEPIALVADLMRVFGEEARVTLTWRGNVALASPDEHVVLAAGVVTGTARVDFMKTASKAGRTSAPPVAQTAGATADLPVIARPIDEEATCAEGRDIFSSMTLPFTGGAVGEATVRQLGPVPGAPWAAPLPDVPGASMAKEGTALSRGGNNIVDRAAKEMLAKLGSPPGEPHATISEVARAATPESDVVGYVKLRDTPGSRFLALALAELKKRERGG